MRIAIIDLGTNTFNLLITDLFKDDFKLIMTEREIVKIGEGGLNTGLITEAAFIRGVDAIGKHMERIKNHHCDYIKAVATSGIRSTSNGEFFIDTLREKYDLTVEIIDGDREAELIWKGTMLACPSEQKSIIMDIGGGSTELLIADKNKIYYKESFLLGVSRLKDRFQPTDPITKKEIDIFNNYINTTLLSLTETLENHPCHILIGSSGTFDTLCEMELHRLGRAVEFDKSECHTIHLNEFYTSYDFLINSTLRERLNTPGIMEMRADMIVIGVLLVKYIIQKADITDIQLSKFALKEGLLKEIQSSSFF